LRGTIVFERIGMAWSELECIGTSMNGLAYVGMTKTWMRPDRNFQSFEILKFCFFLGEVEKC
jgi:hypothetical protein